MTTLDEMEETFWAEIGQRNHLEIGGAFAAVLRKHVEPMIAEAWRSGRGAADWEPSEQIWTQGGGSYTTEKPPSPERYAASIIAAISSPAEEKRL